MRAYYYSHLQPTECERGLFVRQWLMEYQWGVSVKCLAYSERCLANAIGWASR